MCVCVCVWALTAVSPGLVVGDGVLQVHPEDVQRAGQQLQGQVEQSDPQACGPSAGRGSTVRLVFRPRSEYTRRKHGFLSSRQKTCMRCVFLSCFGWGKRETISADPLLGLFCFYRILQTASSGRKERSHLLLSLTSTHVCETQT